MTVAPLISDTSWSYFVQLGLGIPVYQICPPGISWSDFGRQVNYNFNFVPPGISFSQFVDLFTQNPNKVALASSGHIFIVLINH
jgi:hypothetical protein